MISSSSSTAAKDNNKLQVGYVLVPLNATTRAFLSQFALINIPPPVSPKKDNNKKQDCGCGSSIQPKKKLNTGPTDWLLIPLLLVWNQKPLLVPALICPEWLRFFLEEVVVVVMVVLLVLLVWNWNPLLVPALICPEWLRSLGQRFFFLEEVVVVFLPSAMPPGSSLHRWHHAH